MFLSAILDSLRRIEDRLGPREVTVSLPGPVELVEPASPKAAAPQLELTEPEPAKPVSSSTSKRTRVRDRG